MTDPRLLGNISMIERHLGQMEGHLVKLMRVQQRAQQVAEYGFLNHLALSTLGEGQRVRLIELRKHLWPEGDGS